LAVSPNVRVTGFQAKPPEPIATALVSDGRKALRDIEDLRAKGMFIPGMDELQRGIESALAEGRLAWLRRALAGYIVRKCRAELARE
jgi:hypothetical protein